MIVTHYLELLRYYRWLVTILIMSTTLTACGLSLLVLFVAPSYTASTSVTMLPTRSELAFTSEPRDRAPLAPERDGRATSGSFIKKASTHLHAEL